MIQIPKQQSMQLNALKMLMILFVIFIHENPTAEKTGIVSLWFHQIVVVAVPVFFILSGYFFFMKGWDRDCSWTDTYLRKNKIRIKTLLVPYLLWNLLPVFNVCAGNFYSILFRGKSTDALVSFLSGLWDEGLWHIWWDKTSGTMPFDSPLWYVRDLMILCMLSPAIYYAVRRSGWMLAAVLTFVYICDIWKGWIGLSLTGMLFFSLGATLALKERNLSDFPVSMKVSIGILSVFCYVLSRMAAVPYSSQIFIVSSSICWIWLFCQLRGRIIGVTGYLSETVFFIFAVHNTFVLAVVGKVVTKGTGLSCWGGYFVTPFITLAICIIMYKVLNKICPYVIKVLCGNR